MAKLTNEIKNKIIADWKAGHSQNRLAKDYELSPATINKLCKGIEQENIHLVNTQIAVKQALADKSEYEVNSIQKLVDERTKHIHFLNNATLKNLSTMIKKIDEKTTVYEHKLAQETIAKGKEVLLGKEPEAKFEANVNVTNTAAIQQSITTQDEASRVYLDMIGK